MAESESSRILRVGSNKRLAASVPRLTFPPPPRGLLLGFHAQQLFACATKTKIEYQTTSVNSIRMTRKTFSESFSKWVRNGSSLQRPSYLILFEKSHIFATKTGHEPPDSDSRLHSTEGVLANSVGVHAN